MVSVSDPGWFIRSRAGLCVLPHWVRPAVREVQRVTRPTQDGPHSKAGGAGAFRATTPPTRALGVACASKGRAGMTAEIMYETVALLAVSRALVESYPTWSDENGANVDQLAAIVVGALAQGGLLIKSSSDDRVTTST